MSDNDLCVPGHVYIGKDKSQRLLVDRGEPVGWKKDGEFIPKDNGKYLRWRRPGKDRLFVCWISTWLQWVQNRSQ